MQKIKGYADGPFGQIHYTVCGEGKPLVLCHQSPTNSVQFREGMAPLAQRGVQAIAMDTPGYGGSDVPDHPPSITEYGSAVPAVLDHLGIQQASILGHHTGAEIATEALLNYPDRFDRIILNGPVPMNDEERAMFGEMFKKEREFSPRPDGSHLLDAWNFRINAFNGADGIQSLKGFHRHVLAALLAGETAHYAHDAVIAYDHGEALMRIQHPCLILSNDGDAIHYMAERTMEMRPDFELKVLSGGTIDIVDDQPDAWAEAVASWVTQ